ncbi:MAG TPA: hypothetical protein VJA21_17650 [Verrucomicrobiae bacterium]
MKSKLCPILTGLSLLSTVMLQPSAFAQGTAFSYQGRLVENGQPATGRYDFRCQLYDKAMPGGDTLVSGTLTSTAVAVTNGLFVLDLDFGAAVFSGPERWLQILVRTNDNTFAFAALFPRQRLAPAPYAITSGNLTGPLAAAQLSGTLNPAVLPTGGNWPLTSTLTFDGGTLAIDPVNNRVGLGTASPAWPLHLLGPQSVARLDSTANNFGSVLELRNNTPSPTYLGAINFNNAAGTFPGQIGYLDSDALIFRTASAEHMRLDNNGRLDVTAIASSVEINTVDLFPPISFPRAIKATCDTGLGTAILGISANGIALYGSSPNGYAGNFAGAVQINYASPFDKPQLALHDPFDTGWARLRMQTGTRPFWDIAMGGDNSVRFYADGKGDVMVLNTNGQLFVNVLTIRGGADIAEPFKMSEPALPKGAVVVIDEDHPGQLKLSTEPYDQRVAGVLSGAGGVNPGLSLSQQGVVEGDQHVALSGRVYVQADASTAPIKPGDLLTTSATPGHAMKVTDHARAQGAILGKAMTGLKEATGLVLVLVTLQ